MPHGCAAEEKPGVIPAFGRSLPPRRAVFVSGAVKGTGIIGGTQKPLHIVLVQIRFSVIGVRFRVVLVIDALLAVGHGRSPYLAGTISIQYPSGSEMK